MSPASDHATMDVRDEPADEAGDLAGVAPEGGAPRQGQRARFLDPVWIALSMFSRIPVPARPWRGSAMSWAICWWPLVGVAELLACLAWWLACLALSLPAQVTAAGLLILPYAVNGGIHADGFADTVDACASYASRERSLEIMADPRVGSFAALALACLVVATYALLDCLTASRWLGGCLAMGVSFALSRSMAALTVIWMPSAHPGGLADSFGRPARERGAGPTVALVAEAAVSAVLMMILGGIPGACAVAGCLIALGWYRHAAVKRFGGITGDTSGWLVQASELVMLAIVVIVRALM